MSLEKKALGKGLSALISDNTVIKIQGTDEPSEVRSLNVNSIESNPYQPRKEFGDSELEDLANSIKEHGILQPITVRVIGNKYQLVAGERRLQASKRIGLSQVPCIVRDYSDKESFELALIENVQREDLSPIEEALAYERMQKEFSYTQETISKKIGKSRSHVTNTLRLLTLPDDVKSLIASKKISSGHARSLINSPNISELATKIVNDNLSVREVENYVREQKTPSAEKTGKKRHSRLIKEGAEKHFTKDSDLIEIEKMLSETINMPVQINDTLDGGQVVIKFTTLEQLDWIIERLGNEKLNF